MPALPRALGAFAATLGAATAALAVCAGAHAAASAPRAETEALRERIWSLYRITVVTPPDALGRTARDALRDQVEASTLAAAVFGDTPTAEARESLGARLTRLEYYWRWQFVFAEQRARWDEWAELATPEQREAASAGLADAARAFAAGYEPVIDPFALDAARRELSRAWNVARQRLARAVGASRGAELIPAAWSREGACPSPAPTTPTLGSEAPPPYPPQAAARAIFGNVVLRLTLGTGRCAAAAEIVGSSGNPLLDFAALEWARTAAPGAQRPGRAPGSTLRATLSFALGDLRIADDLPTNATRPAATAVLDRLWGVRIGMTRADVRALRGEPRAKMSGGWNYETAGAAGDGLLTVAFDGDGERDTDRVVALDYTGDRASEPRELAGLAGMTAREARQRLGKVLWSEPPEDSGEPPFRLHFANGVWIRFESGRVLGYGLRARQQLPEDPTVTVFLEDAGAG